MLRIFKETDLTAIQDIHAKNHRDSGGLLVGPFYSDGNYYVIENQNRVSAYVNILSELPERVILHTDWYVNQKMKPQGIYIRQTAVDKRLHGYGLGTVIYQELFKLFPDKDFYAHVRDTNHQSLHFHLKNGFLRIGEFHTNDFYGVQDYKAYLVGRNQSTKGLGDS